MASTSLGDSSKHLRVSETEIQQLLWGDWGKNVGQPPCRERLRRVQQHGGSVEAITHHGENDVIPGVGELIARHHLVAQRRIADIDSITACLLHDYEVFVTIEVK